MQGICEIHPHQIPVLLALTLIIYSTFLPSIQSLEVTERYQEDKSCRGGEHNNNICARLHKSEIENETDNDKGKELKNDDAPRCNLYMAESTIQGAGLGIFTSVPIRDQLNVSSPEIVVNTFDLEYQRRLHREYTRRKKDKHPSCHDWSRAGQCEANPDDMLKNCERSCSRDKILRDRHTSCHDWSREGECKANPDWMLVNCERSCNSEKEKALKGQNDGTEADDDDTPYWWLPHNYVWTVETTSSSYEADVPESLVSGLGMLTNCHPGLVNLSMDRPLIDGGNYVRHESGPGDAGRSLHRSIDPGVGAFSNFYGVQYRAFKDIEAGMELFTPYGDQWFYDMEEKLGVIPVGEDYDLADEILENFAIFVNGAGGERGDNDDGGDDGVVPDSSSYLPLGGITEQDLLSFLRNDLVTTRLKMALPSDVHDAKEAHYSGAGSAQQSHSNIRSLRWLHQNGQCLDNIAPRPSTIPQAGRGAFATRPLAKGDLIAPAPMVHIRRSDLHWYEEEGPDWEIELRGEQLILNYCFGHQDSSLLLFPYSSIVNYINHGTERSKINARIQWSNITHHHSEWLYQTPKQVLSHTHAGLVMEFIATSDIEEGDEIFIDYGDRWHTAWGLHLDNWTPMSTAKDYVSAAMLNAEMGEILTPAEDRKDYKFDNVFTVCYVPYYIRNYKEGLVPTNKDGEIEWYNENDLHQRSDYSRKCSILERQHSDDGVEGNSEVLYKATIDTDDAELVVYSIPRDAIEFIDLPYSSDQHILHDSIFRHEINIPDDIFPDAWKDL